MGWMSYGLCVGQKKNKNAVLPQHFRDDDDDWLAHICGGFRGWGGQKCALAVDVITLVGFIKLPLPLDLINSYMVFCKNSLFFIWGCTRNKQWHHSLYLTWLTFPSVSPHCITGFSRNNWALKIAGNKFFATFNPWSDRRPVTYRINVQNRDLKAKQQRSDWPISNISVWPMSSSP